jgi:hypothetical protein
MSVRECFLRNKGVAAMVLEGVTESRSFSGTLSGVEVTRRLNDLSELLICV